jgi:hypothetical protein
MSADAAIVSADASNDRADASSLKLPAQLLSGSFEVPAASSYDDPGFHELFSASAALPDALTATGPLRLVVALRDSSRPDQTCDQEHPISGCATVDWTDAKGRRNVPESGVFDNSVRLFAAGDPQTYFLTEERGLDVEPDHYDPT